VSFTKSRRAALERRAKLLDRFWLDQSRFERVCATGRFLKLCDATSLVVQQLEALDREQFAALRNSRSAETGLASLLWFPIGLPIIPHG
jgi:hypothetical protein